MIKAEIILDSINEQGNRLTTMKLRYPKFIHGEFMTHRVFSRNASSSRAVPTRKLLEEVRSDHLRATPVFWGKNQAGMQANESHAEPIKVHYRNNEVVGFVQNRYVDESIFPATLQTSELAWAEAALRAADMAEAFEKAGYHKQIVNRILEPYSHINVLVTATEWDNFFGLRLHKDAQPEMRALAITMWEARQASTPKLLHPGEWHLPFADDSDGWTGTKCEKCKGCGMAYDSATDIDRTCTDCGGTGEAWNHETAIKVSVARCARVSYESFETGKRSTVKEDLDLYEKLTKGLTDPSEPLHASPMEHQARSLKLMAIINDEPMYEDGRYQGNFKGWGQYRKMLPNEAVAPLPKDYRS